MNNLDKEKSFEEKTQEHFIEFNSQWNELLAQFLGEYSKNYDDIRKNSSQKLTETVNEFFIYYIGNLVEIAEKNKNDDIEYYVIKKLWGMSGDLNKVLLSHSSIITTISFLKVFFEDRLKIPKSALKIVEHPLKVINTETLNKIAHINSH